jgi:hypothetical protein
VRAKGGYSPASDGLSMTTMKLHLDLIDYRRGKIDHNQLRALFPTWKVSREYAAFCVKCAQQSMSQTGDLFA